MSSVGGVGAGAGAGGVGAGAGVGNVVSQAGGCSEAGSAGSQEPAQGTSKAGLDSSASEKTSEKTTDTNSTTAVEMTGTGHFETPQMSTQDFCALRTQAVQPAEETQSIDLQKLLEWLMAVKMLEAMNKGEG